MRRQVQEAETKIRRLLKENDQQQRELEKKDDGIRRMKSDLKKDDDDLKRLKEKVRRRDAQVEELERELRRQEENYELFKHDFKGANVQLSDLKEENAKLRRQLKVLLEFHRAEEKEMLEVDQQLDSLMNFYDQYIHDLDKGKGHQPFKLPQSVQEIIDRVHNYY
ncbi:golgin subfamily A member 6-like protein 7 [Macrobrachium rosenbergii]|uniref:golgin subfamily A member 6-like protein 7 n=1 Tax=Macrobrachium rosenbergii TaxID=79674 RepID=UPI0034D54D27